jgi:hypothetical protein
LQDTIEESSSSTLQAERKSAPSTDQPNYGIKKRRLNGKQVPTTSTGVTLPVEHHYQHLRIQTQNNITTACNEVPPTPVPSSSHTKACM